MGDFVLTAHGGYTVDPFVVAMDRHQRRALLDMMLRDPGFEGVAARSHSTARFYVSDRPVGVVDGPQVERYLRVGFYHNFGGVYFADNSAAEGADWSWVALRSTPMENPPPIYYDQDTETLFPPAAVMPLDEVREIIQEWASTGERPTHVEWLPINRTTWGLTADGDITDTWRRREWDGVPRYVWMNRPTE